MNKIIGTLRGLVKNILAIFLYRTGLLGWLIKNRLSGRYVVLMYHRILPDEDRLQTFSHDAIIVDPARFQMQLDALLKYFDIVSLTQFMSDIETGSTHTRPRLLITFDDAWEDNFHNAYPALVQRKLPATIFVPIDYIGTGSVFWQEELGHLIRAAVSIETPQLHELLKKHGLDDLRELGEPVRSTEIKKRVRDLKQLDYAALDKILMEFRAMVSVQYGLDTYLSIPQMQQMLQHGISFQSHASSHKRLPRLTANEIAEELTRSFNWLDSTLNVQPLAIAYPNGDFDESVIQIANKTGFKLGFSTLSGSVHKADHRFKLKRINIHDDSAGSEARFIMSLYLAC